MQSFKQNGEQGGKWSSTEQSFTDALTCMGCVQVEGRENQWNGLLWGHSEVKPFFCVPSWRCCIVASMTFVVPVNCCGEFWIPQRPDRDHIWQAIDGKLKGREVSLASGRPTHRQKSLQFIFASLRVNSWFSLKYPYKLLGSRITLEQPQQNDTVPRGCLVRGGEQQTFTSEIAEK